MCWGDYYVDVYFSILCTYKIVMGGIIIYIVIRLVLNIGNDIYLRYINCVVIRDVCSDCEVFVVCLFCSLSIEYTRKRMQKPTIKIGTFLEKLKAA
jgi:hypothetical protein